MILQVTTTLPTREDAERVARALVEDRLAACAQVAGPIASTYWWKGQVETSTEWYCHLKTTAERFPALEARLRTLHPYEVPEIIALPAARVAESYREWVTRETAPGR
ncbi:MAG TPA: divalent-cation tolerance protein CutA [Gemmatimonadales bacterium]|nr:divalent-cation tolerance protein CutA [Gemmatimonadales bacterium]